MCACAPGMGTWGMRASCVFVDRGLLSEVRLLRGLTVLCPFHGGLLLRFEPSWKTPVPTRTRK